MEFVKLRFVPASAEMQTLGLFLCSGWFEKRNELYPQPQSGARAGLHLRSSVNHS